MSIGFEEDGEIWDKNLINLKTPMVGTNGVDKFYLTNLDETLILKDGDDIVYAKKGSDYIDAGSGDGTIYADNGDDTLIGGEGDDHLYGENGNDTLIGGKGDDTLEGGEGSDIYIFKGREFGSDTILNYKPNSKDIDTISLPDLKVKDIKLTREFDGVKITNNLIIKVNMSLADKIKNITDQLSSNNQSLNQNLSHNNSQIKILDFFDGENINPNYQIDIIKTKDKTLTLKDITHLTSSSTTISSNLAKILKRLKPL